MQAVSMNTPFDAGVGASTIHFYRGVLEALDRAAVPFLIGGAYAFNHYTHVSRPTRDLDIFIKRADFERAAENLREEGFEVELTYPHWLGKIHKGGVYVDLIFSSGNGIAVVDDVWFKYADESTLLGIRTRISPVEEMIWSKAFVMERERFDGADVIHLLLSCAEQIDWTRLLQRFGPHWRVLLSHLVLFGFAYPAHRNRIPAGVMDDLLQRLRTEMQATDTTAVCQGTLLSREQYLCDIADHGLQDGRIAPFGNMTVQDVTSWTEAIPERDED